MMSAVSAANAVQRFNGYSNLTGKCAANVLGGGRNGGECVHKAGLACAIYDMRVAK